MRNTLAVNLQRPPKGGIIIDTGHDFTALDKLLRMDVLGSGVKSKRIFVRRFTPFNS